MLSRIVVALSVATLLGACANEIAEPGHSPSSRSFTILDGARGGNAQFYFLPPMVPAPNYSGAFDATQHPVVAICELSGTVCATTVATFSGSSVKLDVKAQAYSVSWKTKDAGLDPAKTYRVQVLIGTRVLGYADLVVLNSGNQIKTIDKNQFVAVINGGVLPINFRIEGGAASPGWKDGDVITYDQATWGGDQGTSKAAALLAGSFATVFPSGVEAGVSGTNGFSMSFTSANAVLSYLPASGTPARLTADLTDPTSSPAGVFGGEALALQLNVAFADAGLTRGTSMAFGDLTICGVEINLIHPFHNLTVRQFLALVNGNLGQSVSVFFDLAAFSPVVAALNSAFAGGKPSQFAQDHLVHGACPATWRDGDLVTYEDVSWGEDPAVDPAAALLLNHFGDVYPLSAVEIGISGLAGYSAIFTSAQAILAFLPQGGTPSQLTGLDLVDPTSTSAGALAGAVLALRLNQDFSAAGYLVSLSGLRLADLRLCGFSTYTALNGRTVGDYSRIVNEELGGMTPHPEAPYTLDESYLFAVLINAAFSRGSPSAFAQMHLVNGACP